MRHPFLKKEDTVYLHGLSEEKLPVTYLDWLNDREVTQYMERCYFPTTAEDARKYIRKCNDGNNLLLNIVAAQDDRDIGNIRLGPIYWIQRQADINILIGDHDYRRKEDHTVQAAIELVLEYAFMRLGLVKVSVSIIEDDTESIHLYEKLGFRKEAILRRHTFLDGVFHNVFLYGLLDENFTNQF